MAKAKQLDRTRYFIEVWGDDQGRSFMQDHVYFDGQGNEWKPDPEPVVAAAAPASAAPTAKPTVAAAQPAASSQVDKQLSQS